MYRGEQSLTSLVNTLFLEFEQRKGCGKVADYIPALANVDVQQFGVAIQTLEGEKIACGDAQVRFSIQSVSKLFAFAMAFAQRGESVWERLGKEPSGTSFNSLFQLEAENGIPRNPFINAGAMVITDMLIEDFDDPMGELLSFLHNLTGCQDIDYDEEVYASELAYGSRNAALCYLMKSFGNINHSVRKVLDLYFMQCSIRMTCMELAQSAQFLACGGINPLTGTALLTRSQTKRTNALMLTTGLYNEAGDFAFRVGIPAKSGVGGGIVGLIPGVLSVATWAPGLNAIGNSMLGIDFLEEFTTRTGLSIF